MRSAPVPPTDVLIVGFGPVGAMLAGLLGRRGLRVVVVERELDVYALPRAAHIDHTGLRALQELGCLDRVLPEMIPNPGLDFVTADGTLLFRLPSDRPSTSGLPTSRYFHQPGFDRAVRATVAELQSVDLRLGMEMTGFEAGPQGVEVEVRTLGGKRSRLAASWLVGCDGAWSPVREAGGIPLEDLGFEEQWLVVDLILERLVPSLPDRAISYCDPARPLTAIPMPNRRYRFELMVMPGEEPSEVSRPDKVLDILRHHLPRGAARIERAAVYTFHGLLAERFRVGRVLIAGDAAHQMPPFLGQGMCSGLRDATNLAWKLDQVVARRAGERLLDTYGDERRPHVGAIIRAAVEFGRVICETDPAAAAERDRRILEHPGSAVDRAPFGLPSLEPGPLVLDGAGSFFPQPVDGVVRMDDLVGQRFLVLARTAADLGRSARWWAEATGALVATVDQMGPFESELAGWLDRQRANVVVVRPDRYVLGAGPSLDGLTGEVRELLAPQPIRASAVNIGPSH
jgi:3-(3-hydroxy-phenyl)propionate hydroxylase